ncbi:MBL fold metallo-hydrolase [Paraconexibacter sp.]|uniref:MBL fold metallo-hydrolase n=1 Tax=Paraconexibacter sp. TaxID=2949640 RepID=UPI00356B3AB8
MSQDAQDPAVWRAAEEAGIHVMAIPTPFAVGRVNTYLIEDDPLTLVDSGPNSGKALDELERALADRGHRVEDLERIVVTHQHIDHEGLVSILARRSGAEVCALDLLAPWLSGYAAETIADDAFAQALMRRHGLPSDVITALSGVSQAFRGWGAACEVTTLLTDGGELPFADRTLAVHHRPGHSPSDTIFHDPQRGILLGGDHLIGHISSNPLISRPLDGTGLPPDRPRALMTYLASMRRTQAMELDVILPGHGVPVTDHRALIDDRIRLHDRRATKIAALIAGQPLSAYEIAQSMWGNVAVTQAFLTLSEVLGHIDLLLADGRAVEVDADGEVARFRAT